MKHYEAMKNGKEIVIVGAETMNTAVFWINDDEIMTWSREFGTFARDKECFPPERFEAHCETMITEGCQVFIRG